MKRFIHASNEDLFPFNLDKVVSIVLVSDARNYNPKHEFISASKRHNDIDYYSLNKDQLMKLPSRVREGIHDPVILRKLDYSDLTLQQQRDVTQSNKQHFPSRISEINDVLNKLKQQKTIFIWPTSKNTDFISDLNNKGCEVTPKDVRNIIRSLSIDDYKHSTLSFLPKNWNSLLMVFEFNDDYTFDPIDEEDDSILISSLRIYIKIDVGDDGNGYAAMSFHYSEDSKPIHKLNPKKG